MPLVTRAQAGLLPAKGALNAINAKPDGVVVHWEGPKMGNFQHSKCAGYVKSIQRHHQVNNGWADIAYNYVVCPHGFIFEGRGLTRGSAANGTTDANRRYYAVCALMGQGDVITAAMMAGLKEAVQLCRTKAGSKVLGHRDIIATACPGSLYNRLNELRTVPAVVAVTVKKAAQKTVQKVTKAPLAVDGVMGPKTISQWQKVMGTPVDGKISKPSLLVKAVQKVVGVKQDGYLGPITWKAVQRRLGVPADGIPGPVTIKALQRRLNTGKF